MFITFSEISSLDFIFVIYSSCISESHVDILKNFIFSLSKYYSSFSKFTSFPPQKSFLSSRNFHLKNFILPFKNYTFFFSGSGHFFLKFFFFPISKREFFFKNHPSPAQNFHLFLLKKRSSLSPNFLFFHLKNHFSLLEIFIPKIHFALFDFHFSFLKNCILLFKIFTSAL